MLVFSTGINTNQTVEQPKRDRQHMNHSNGPQEDVQQELHSVTKLPVDASDQIVFEGKVDHTSGHLEEWCDWSDIGTTLSVINWTGISIAMDSLGVEYCSECRQQE